MNHLYNDKIFLKNIETSTRDQANSEIWFCERAKRITASNSGSVINRNQKISCFLAEKATTIKAENGSCFVQVGEE